MDTSAMVRKISILAIGIIVALSIIAILRLTRRCKCNEYRESKIASTIETSLEHQEEPLTGEEAEECFRAFEEICSAYSNLQFETMQERFCGISNKVVRLGKGQLDKLIDPLQITFRERFWSDSRNLPDFATVSNFDRHLNANVVAVKILGFSIAANDVYNTDLLGYDVVVFKRITAYLRKFKENGNEQLALSAQMHLDEWKEYLASEQSLFV